MPAEYRFYLDPDSGRPHLENHGVTPVEAIEVIETAIQDYHSDRGARIALGRTRRGRYLQVVYKWDDELSGMFVITAFPLSGKRKQALRRRMRRG